MLLGGDRALQIDQCVIGFARFRREARRDIAEVAAGESRALVDRTR
jgi:hypothetical protein